ncbi:MAG: hypothetical protein F6K10_35660 [Moorea sp. SIO2B7]|nr:hypothetical protein [Moorena sp. SIO2B7]
MEKKIRELATKYDLPEALIKEAMKKEKEKVFSQNRKLAPVLVRMIERYAESL